MELFSVCTLKVYYQTFGVQITCESRISVYTKKYSQDLVHILILTI